VDATAAALKQTRPALDSDRGMQTQELKLRVQRADYVVDPEVVAAAIIRHAISHRRCWKPRTVLRTPPALSTTSGGPSSTVPTQVSGVADSVAARSAGATHTHNS
jgi:hypothetical protein